MSLIKVHLRSNAVGLNMGMNVLVPDGRPGPFPVFYLLHGLTDDHTIWGRRSNIECYSEGLPLIVAMPETGRGWYVNAKSQPGRNYEDLIIKDVVGFMDRTFRTIPTRAGRAIGGLSMGGWGAVNLSLKHPDMFCSVTSHSGPLVHPMYKLWEDNKPDAANLEPEFIGIFGKTWRGTGSDNVMLAKKCPKGRRPKMRIDCGTEDFLLRNNRDFHKALVAMKFEHEYEEFPGAHHWDYWDLHVKDALAFHCRNLGIKR
jgi:S-formylglutathione hydrolase FrmB